MCIPICVRVLKWVCPLECVRRCDLSLMLLEMDRVLRPHGYIIIRERADMAPQVEAAAKAFHWNQTAHIVSGNEVLFAFEKGFWRPAPEASKD